MTVEAVRLDETFTDDPQQAVRLLREQGPVRPVLTAWNVRGWLVTGYADARALLADDRISKDNATARTLLAGQLGEDEEDTGFLAQSLGDHMLNSDPPQHTRLRKLVNTAFTGRRVAALRPRVEQITEELLDAMAGRDEVDLLEAFALPLPITVICELLGVPDMDRDRFRTWSNTMLSSGPRDEVQQSSVLLAGYLAELIEHKRRTPGDDLMTSLIEASDDGDRLSEGELISMAFLLLVAGHDTTVNLIGNGVLALLRHPDQLAALRADPGLLPGAVEEFLRYDGPVNIATLRFTKESIEVGGVAIPEGEFVLISLLGANRDAERFADPHSLDVTRQAGGHLAFGHGIHYCLGAPLARLEGEIAFGGLVRRFPGLALAAAPGERLHWRRSTLMHGLERLPVRLR
ncbi:cytochrome P450 family protein [Amycolatopsis suaedae]|uniref:Cytochrome P450 n=1 Tax=Amycolatopsis suaedae TaxID=2510978 RepID=A0A4Q7IZ76_9PSEU|nr:cytochrome P450 [Amycolatopsis suaedae]RZQ59396.1 cytochrome P450 [Amycolatopsis suaedae]